MSSPQREPPRPSSNAHRTFTLSSLMLVMTLIAVCLGVGTVAPGLGIALGIAATPAVLRTTVLVQDHKVRFGRSPEMSGKVLTFVASLGLVLVIGVAVVTAFYVTCFVGFFGGAAAHEVAFETRGYDGDGFGMGLIVGVIVGGAAALVVLVLGVRAIWPRRRK